MQLTQRNYPTTKYSPRYSTTCQTAHVRAEFVTFPGPKKPPKLVRISKLGFIPLFDFASLLKYLNSLRKTRCCMLSNPKPQMWSIQLMSLCHQNRVPSFSSTQQMISPKTFLSSSSFINCCFLLVVVLLNDRNATVR